MREKGNELVYIPGIGQNLLNYVWAGAIFNSVWADTIIVWGVICLNYYTLHRISINGVYLHIYAISPSPPRVVKLSRRENIIHLSVCQKTYTILSSLHRPPPAAAEGRLRPLNMFGIPQNCQFNIWFPMYPDSFFNQSKVSKEKIEIHV
jgi:hypothetical protein